MNAVGTSEPALPAAASQTQTAQQFAISSDGTETETTEQADAAADAGTTEKVNATTTQSDSATVAPHSIDTGWPYAWFERQTDAAAQAHIRAAVSPEERQSQEFLAPGMFPRQAPEQTSEISS